MGISHHPVQVTSSGEKWGIMGEVPASSQPFPIVSHFLCPVDLGSSWFSPASDPNEGIEH